MFPRLLPGRNIKEIATNAFAFGNSNWLDRDVAGQLIGVGAESQLIISVWAKFNIEGVGGASGFDNLLYASDQQLGVQRMNFISGVNNNEWQIFARPTGGGAIHLGMESLNKVTKDVWHHLLASADLTANKAHMRIDDVDDLNTAFTTTDTNMDFSEKSDFGIGAIPDEAASGSIGKFDGCMAEVYLAWGEYLDLDIEANRRKFISANLKPVNLGPRGQYPTGNQPLIYVKRLDTGVNLGKGGPFEVNGTIVTCADAPPAP